MTLLTDESSPHVEADLDRACIWLHLTERQATDLASGYVSAATKSRLRELLDYREEDERRASRPVAVKKGSAR